MNIRYRDWTADAGAQAPVLSLREGRWADGARVARPRRSFAERAPSLAIVAAIHVLLAWLVVQATMRNPPPIIEKIITVTIDATELGVATMTPYTHVESKDELIDLMRDAVAAEMILPEPVPDDWREALRAIAHKTKDAFEAHPWSLDITSRRPRARINRLSPSGVADPTSPSTSRRTRSPSSPVSAVNQSSPAAGPAARGTIEPIGARISSW